MSFKESIRLSTIANDCFAVFGNGSQPIRTSTFGGPEESASLGVTNTNTNTAKLGTPT
jgi:hypothetical protein